MRKRGNNSYQRQEIRRNFIDNYVKCRRTSEWVREGERETLFVCVCFITYFAADSNSDSDSWPTTTTTTATVGGAAAAATRRGSGKTNLFRLVFHVPPLLCLPLFCYFSLRFLATLKINTWRWSCWGWWWGRRQLQSLAAVAAASAASWRINLTVLPFSATTTTLGTHSQIAQHQRVCVCVCMCVYTCTHTYTERGLPQEPKIFLDTHGAKKCKQISFLLRTRCKCM